MWEWLGNVAALEGASFAGVCNVGIIALVIYTSVRKEPLSWALLLRVVVLILVALLMFLACMAVVGFAGIP